MLNAQFLGIVQILVYAAAIVVLFLFVVMLLGRVGRASKNLVDYTQRFIIALGFAY